MLFGLKNMSVFAENKENIEVWLIIHLHLFNSILHYVNLLYDSEKHKTGPATQLRFCISFDAKLSRFFNSQCVGTCYAYMRICRPSQSVGYFLFKAVKLPLSIFFN
jgi:hypothetical protein